MGIYKRLYGMKGCAITPDPAHFCAVRKTRKHGKGRYGRDTEARKEARRHGKLNHESTEKVRHGNNRYKV